MSMPTISENINDNSVVDNIINDIQSENQLDPNNIQVPIQNQNQQYQPKGQPSFKMNNSNGKIMNFVQNFKSSIIVGIIIVLFSFPQVNKVGKVILNVKVINNLKYSYVFPYILNGAVGGVLYYYMSNLNI